MNLFICDYDIIRSQEGALFQQRSNKTWKISLLRNCYS